jgi:hypothetical protein
MSCVYVIFSLLGTIMSPHVLATIPFFLGISKLGGSSLLCFAQLLPIYITFVRILTAVPQRFVVSQSCSGLLNVLGAATPELCKKLFRPVVAINGLMRWRQQTFPHTQKNDDKFDLQFIPVVIVVRSRHLVGDDKERG